MYLWTSLSRQEVAQSIQQGQLAIPRDWLDDGGWLFALLAMGIIGVLLLGNGPHTPITWRSIAWATAVAVLMAYSVYCLRQERILVPVVTNLPAAANKELVLTAFQQLGWTRYQRAAGVVTATVPCGKWAINEQRAVAILLNGRILLNILHVSANHRGRLPFSFGYNALRMNELRTQLHLLLDNPSPTAS